MKIIRPIDIDLLSLQDLLTNISKSNLNKKPFVIVQDSPCLLRETLEVLQLGISPILYTNDSVISGDIYSGSEDLRSWLMSSSVDKKRQLVESIFNNLNILPLMNVFKTNPSGDIGYHNNYHTMTMIINTYNACQLEMLDDKSQKILVISSLYHDFNHSGGESTDDQNIIRALNAVENSPYLDFFIELLADIKDTVAVTQYPYLCQPHNIYQKIIRDCDLLQSLEPNWLEQLFIGLLSEINVSQKMKNLSPFTSLEFADMQIKFINSLHFYSNYGKLKKFELTNKFLPNVYKLKNEFVQNYELQF